MMRADARSTLSGTTRRRAWALVALLTACATDAGPPSHVLVSLVEVAPPADTVAVAATLQLTAVPKDANGVPLSGRPVTWSSSDVTIAGISGSGLVTGVAPGAVTITATSEGQTGTAAITVMPAPAVRLAFTDQPTQATAAAVFSPAVQVTAQGAQGNTATGFVGDVTVAIATNGGGGTLGGTSTVAAVAGVATFPGLSIDKVGTGYTLSATSPPLSAGTSGPIDITTGPATQLAFTVQPASAQAGAAITPAVQVTARDVQGNTATDFVGSVSVVIGTNPAGGALSGTTTRPAVAGVATFPGLGINLAHDGYTLSATAAGLTTAASTSFNITPSTATRLAFSAQPVTTTAGAPIAALRVSVRDSLGNTVTGFTEMVTLSIAPGSGASGATLGGTTGVAAVGGVATFSDLHIDRSGTGYAFLAAAVNLTGATSTSFDIVAGPAAQLVFAVDPSTASAGATITPQVEVVARDAQGNTAGGFSGDVTVALANNPAGAALSGTTTVTAIAGIAVFGDLSIDKAGTGYTLSVSASGPAGTTSAAFDIVSGQAGRLVFTVQPTTATASTTIQPAIEITARDSLNTTVTGFSGDVTVSITAGTGTAGATLLGTTTVGAGAGVARFADLSIGPMGVGYQLSATAPGMVGAISASFDVIAGAATRLVFTRQPTTATAGTTFSPAVEVTVQDAQGNTATGFVGNVTVAIATNAGGGTLGGTATVAAVAGVATFSDLSIDKSGSGYTLSAASAALTAATSAAIDVAAGAGTRLVFTRQPTTAVAGTTFSPAVDVTAQDAQDNTATSFVGDVAVAIATNGGGGTLGGTTTVTAIAGVATFSDLSIDKGGLGYTLSAASAPLIAGTSAAIDVTTGPATQLVFTVQPANTQAGAAITPAVQVTARDAQGNTALDFVGSVSVAIGTNPAGGTLSGTTTRTAVAGVATFSDLKIDKRATGYVLTAASTGLSSAVSGAFNITATSVVLVGAGDIANCSSSGDEATANLLDGIAGTVFTAGDNAYPDGSAANYTQCYAPTWGRHKARTRPSPGNHEYTTAGAPGYFGYFGAAAGPAGLGYYSYDLGDWHIISLNSNITMAAGSPQEKWLRADLAASSKQCTLAYWHYPRFNSGPRGNSTSTQPLWQALYDAGGEIVISGHDHDYQRFAPMTPTGTRDNSRGIREFVVGTGGTGLYDFSTPIANTEAYNTSTHGVLKLTLSADGSNAYAWTFIPIAGQTFTDAGSGTCH